MVFFKDLLFCTGSVMTVRIPLCLQLKKIIEEKCSACFQVFGQEIQSELKSEILELKTEIENLKVSGRKAD